MRVLWHNNDGSRFHLKRELQWPAPYSPPTEKKRSCPNNVCMMSKVDSLSILKFRGAAIVLETNMVS
jgi:hypothetical protein